MKWQWMLCRRLSWEWNSATDLVIQQMRNFSLESSPLRVTTISVCPGLKGFQNHIYCQNQDAPRKTGTSWVPHHHSSFSHLIKQNSVLFDLLFQSCSGYSVAQFFFFFFFLAIPNVGEWVSDHLHKTSVSSGVYCHQWKHLQLYEFGKCWMRYVIIMMHRK